MKRARIEARKQFAADLARRDALRSPEHLPSLPIDGTKYRGWWLNRYGYEATVEIARDFVAAIDDDVYRRRRT